MEQEDSKWLVIHHFFSGRQEKLQTLFSLRDTAGVYVFGLEKVRHRNNF